MNMTVENPDPDVTCVVDGCPRPFKFPDEDGRQYCQKHYPEPNDGEFSHVPDEPTNRREELRNAYE